MTPSARGLDAVLGALPLDLIGADPIELAEAVWLARYLPRVEPRGAAAGPGGARGGDGDGSAERDARAWLSLLDPAAEQAAPALPGEAAPHPPAGAGPDAGRPGDEVPPAGTREGSDVRVPYGPALPGQHLFLKALQDFKIPVRTGPPVELDVDATIRDSARTGYIVARMRPRERLHLSALCVLDTSRSMAVWQRAARAFARTLADSGVFREVEVVDVDEDGRPSRQPHRAPAGGARVAFLISDGVGTAWSRPGFLDRLASWARSGPLVVLNPLPEHLWNRTALRPAHSNLRALSPTPANARMAARAHEPEDWSEPGAAPGAALESRPRIPLPILEFGPRQLAAWAGFLRQPSADGFNCALAVPAVTDAVSTGGPAPARPGADGGPGTAEPAAATAGFLASASAAAVRLAEYLSQLGGWMNLAIMRYVQDFAVPGSGSTPLAEVLLSGLMVERPGGARDPGGRQYRFHELSREVLKRNLPNDAPERTIEFIVGRIARAYTTSSPGQGFPARAVIGAAAAPGAGGEAPFAVAGLELARKLGAAGPPDPRTRPEPSTEADLLSARADDAHARFLRSGRIEDLDEAIGNRLTAVACSQDDQRAEMNLRLAREMEYRWLYSLEDRDLILSLRYRDNARAIRGESPDGPGRGADPSIPGYPMPPIDVGQARMYLQRFEADPASGEKPAELALFRFTVAVALSGSAGDPEPESAAAAEAINLYQEALSMITEKDAPTASWNRVAATRALELARAVRRPESLDWAVRLLRTTARQAPSGDAEGTTLLADLAGALHTRYDVRGEPADLAEAVLHLRTVTARQTGAAGALPEERRALCLIELGRAFEDRYELDRRIADLGEAAQSYREAAEATERIRPDLNAESLVAWGSVLHRLGNYDEAAGRLSQGIAVFERLRPPDDQSVSEARRLLAEVSGQPR